MWNGKKKVNATWKISCLWLTVFCQVKDPYQLKQGTQVVFDRETHTTILILFSRLQSTRGDTHNTRTLILMNARAQTYPYEHLQRLSRHALKIDEVTIASSLLMGISHTPKSTIPLNLDKFAPTGRVYVPEGPKAVS
jgi:hypothetical protein